MSQQITVPSGGNGPLTPKDFASGQDVRWCPGCGDYSILTQVKKILPALGIPKENVVFVSGIGCSSRFPYYMDTYGMHGIHGRAIAIASGIKAAHPELSVWVVTGDGDGLSIGGNHLLHALRRNFDINILLFNNRIYGLTKGQYSPTSKRTGSSPDGTIDYPVHPISVAIGAEASFIARTIDVHVKHLAQTLDRAVRHKGTSFVEIYQDCNIFNHLAFEYATDKRTKADNIIELQHGRPLIFGKEHNKGIRLNGLAPEIVTLGEGITEDDLLFHDEQAPEPSLAYLLSRMHHPEFPEPIGVFRAVQRATYEDLLAEQVSSAVAQRGVGTLVDLFNDADTWTVEATGRD
jgi:2-oxoglutarate ferredoxin oxidoreductase subunit beta